MSTHAMIDLETLGTKPDCVVLTLGAIKFNPYTQTEPDKGLYIRLDVDEQTKMGRSVDDGLTIVALSVLVINNSSLYNFDEESHRIPTLFYLGSYLLFA